jgi:single-strand selective monofunctional uracil DNA glycosylase
MDNRFISMLEEEVMDLGARVNSLDCSSFALVFNPLDYAKDLHLAFLRRFIAFRPKAILLGMNPGPYGMLQDGIPFGSTDMVRSYLGLDLPIREPGIQPHGFRIEGLGFRRQEVSGTRFWSYFRTLYPVAEDFARDFALFNYCPLGFLDKQKGTNIPLDKIPSIIRSRLLEICDQSLGRVIALVQPSVLIGLGSFAYNRLIRLETGLPAYRMEHPSPLNRNIKAGDWASLAERALREAKVI